MGCHNRKATYLEQGERGEDDRNIEVVSCRRVCHEGQSRSKDGNGERERNANGRVSYEMLTRGMSPAYFAERAY